MTLVIALLVLLVLLALGAAPPACGVTLFLWAWCGVNRRGRVAAVAGLYAVLLCGWLPFAADTLTRRGVNDGSGPPYEPIYSTTASLIVLGVLLAASLVGLGATVARIVRSHGMPSERDWVSSLAMATAIVVGGLSGALVILTVVGNAATALTY